MLSFVLWFQLTLSMGKLRLNLSTNGKQTLSTICSQTSFSTILVFMPCDDIIRDWITSQLDSKNSTT